MAYNANELFSETTREEQKRCAAKRIAPKTFAAVGAAPEYDLLTPVAYNTATNKWVVWTSGGANGTGTIKGFTWPDKVQTDADEEVLGNVMLEGEVHYDDIELPSGETADNLKTALRSGPRDIGLHITGLDQVR